jgi:outer membrane protein assembly factor BamB
MTLLRSLCVFSVLLSSLTNLSARDWPGWRGPNRDDVSAENGLLTSWPEDGPAKLWMSTDAGLGYAGMATSDGVLYTLGADDDGEFAIAINTANGETMWQTPVGQFLKNSWGDGPRGTPTVAGDRLVCVSGRGTVSCLSRQDGSVVWSVEMSELGGKTPNWGYTESPLVDGDKVICTPGGRDGTMACLSLQTGKKLWQSNGITSKAHYSSAIKADHFGTLQYIQLTVDRVFGVDPESGEVLWQEEWPGRTAVVPTPIYRDGMVYVTSGYGVGCMLLRISDDNAVEKLYENKVMKNHHGGVLLLGDYLYGHSDAIGVVCQDFLTGEQVWSDGRKNASKGSVTCADGMLYRLEERTGDCVLIKATPEGMQEISRFRLDPQTEQRSRRGKVWTHPIISNGRMYLRDQEIICCYDIAQQN